jgi:uncharacterized membrane protein
MSDPDVPLKIVHILSAIVLLGVGAGTAFHTWMAHLSGDARVIARAARSTVLADFLFTTPAVIVQPVSGAALIWIERLDPAAPWLIATFGLYALAGACWLPVVRLQIRARDLAVAAAASGQALTAEYHRAMRLWFALGWPAFGAVILIVCLMVAKPELW